MNSQEWNSWISAISSAIQAIGSITAIWTTIYIARKTEKFAIISEKKIDIKQSIFNLGVKLSKNEDENISLTELKISVDQTISSMNRVNRELTGEKIQLIKREYFDTIKNNIDSYSKISKNKHNVRILLGFNSGLPTVLNGANEQKNHGVNIYYDRIMRRLLNLNKNIDDILKTLDVERSEIKTEMKLLKKELSKIQ